MKSVIRFSVLISLVVFCVVPRNVTAGSIVGAKIGLSINNTNTPASVSTTKELLGIWFDSEIVPMLHLQPELLYRTFQTNWSYLDIPLLLKVKLGAAFLKPYAAAGLQASFQLSSPTTTYSSLNLGIPFGGGLELDLAGIVVGVDARYLLGISDVDSRTTVDLRTSAWQFSLAAGLTF